MPPTTNLNICGTYNALHSMAAQSHQKGSLTSRHAKSARRFRRPAADNSYLSAKSFKDHVIVLVGPKEVKFMAHTEVICARSTFFKAACSNKWNSSDSVKLPEDDPDVFDCYIRCLYENTTCRAGNDEKVFLRSVRSWILADKLGDSRSANLFIDSLIAYSDEAKVLPTPQCTSFALANTAATSPLRRLMVDYRVHECTLTQVKQEINDLAWDVLAAMVLEHRRIEETCPDISVNAAFRWVLSAQPRCHYHLHDEANPSCVDKAKPTRWDARA